MKIRSFLSILLCGFLLSACMSSEVANPWRVEGSMPFDGKLMYSQ